MQHQVKQQLRLHVGLVGPLPPPFGGMANQTRQLHDLLASEGIEVTLVQTNAPYRPNIVRGVRGVRALFRLVPYLFKVWALADKVDVIHLLANSGWSWQLFSAPVIWIGWLRDKPVIVNYRGGEAAEYFLRSFKTIRPTLEKARLIVVPSGYLKKVFSDFGFQAEVIPNIVNTKRFRPHASTAPSLDQARHLVITRNLEPIYGLSVAIRSISLLKREIPDIKLSIAGSGPQREELESLVRQLNLEENVVFTGRLAPDDVATLYRRAWVMLNPTTVDNMPNSILEAMASGIPVITTNVGGIPYVTEDEKTAILVPVNDPGAMAEQVKRLSESPRLYRDLVENGLKEVGKYTWPIVKKQWLELYCRFRKEN